MAAVVRQLFFPAHHCFIDADLKQVEAEIAALLDEVTE